jgi:hypothetical protein
MEQAARSRRGHSRVHQSERGAQEEGRLSPGDEKEEEPAPAPIRHSATAHATDAPQMRHAADGRTADARHAAEGMPQMGAPQMGFSESIVAVSDDAAGFDDGRHGWHDARHRSIGDAVRANGAGAISTATPASGVRSSAPRRSENRVKSQKR